MAKLTSALSTAMARITGQGGEVEALARLSGGATMESWSFDFCGEGFVLRRAPSDEMMAGRVLGLENEAELVVVARNAGVTAPEVIGILEPDDGLGRGYVMRRVKAEVSPAIILADPPSHLIQDIARELAAIHKIRPREDLQVPRLDVPEMLADFKLRFAEYGGDRPIIALAIKWCEDNMPEPAQPVLVHGDFRMGNLMVDKAGLAAVLDWELAHWGDAHDDLAYGCLNAWRFGQLDKPAYGLASLKEFFAVYEASGGVAVDRELFHFWFVFRTLWWALGCLQMGGFWRSGADRNLERAVIGRRTGENELDLLMLLEEDAPEAEKKGIILRENKTAACEGEPSATELLEAVKEWIASDVKAAAQGREKFMAAVAMNALGMVQRELANPIDYGDKALCNDILAGRKSLATSGLLAALREKALRKLANDVPKYAPLKVARTKWKK